MSEPKRKKKEADAKVAEVKIQYDAEYAEELAKVSDRNPIEQMVVRSSRRRIAFQGLFLYSLAVLLIL